MSLTQIADHPRTLPTRRTRLAIMSLLLACLMALSAAPAGTPGLDIFLKHFLLHPGEQIH